MLTVYNVSMKRQTETEIYPVIHKNTISY